MHQQVRTMTRKAPSDSAGAKPDEGSLIDILTILRTTNLRSVGGKDLDRRGEFVFSVHHEEGDDSADLAARDVLRDKGYRAELFKVECCLLEDEEGALLKCIENTKAETKEPVVELHVGTAEKSDGRIPVQIVTRSMIERGQAG
jgi:hypothetical protein